MTDERAPAPDSLAQSDPWRELRRLTPARIALGRVGASLPTAEVLDLQLAHARARDAVHRPLDVAALERDLARRGYPTCVVRSAAPDRATYLQRPDLGRQLEADSLAQLERHVWPDAGRWKVAFVCADGLSPLAVQLHAANLLDGVTAAIGAAGWAIAPIVIAQQGRVALGDGIGAALRCDVVAMLIGERPGLSAADSLGVYITYAPRLGRTDAERNCISNIRPNGLGYAAAARSLLYLLRESRRLRLSGVALKDASEDGAPDALDDRNIH